MSIRVESLGMPTHPRSQSSGKPFHSQLEAKSMKSTSQIHKEDARYWTRPVRNCDDMAYAQKQYAAKAPLVVLVLMLIKVIALAFL
jgi:hypothetical protein